MAYASKSDMAGISTVNGRQDMTSLYLSDSVRGNGGPFETFCLPDLPFVGGVGGGGGALEDDEDEEQATGAVEDEDEY